VLWNTGPQSLNSGRQQRGFAPSISSAQRWVPAAIPHPSTGLVSRDENTSSYDIRAHTSSYELMREGAGQDMRCVIVRDGRCTILLLFGMLLLAPFNPSIVQPLWDETAGWLAATR
jgi:hypothetical protein